VRWCAEKLGYLSHYDICAKRRKGKDLRVSFSQVLSLAFFVFLVVCAYMCGMWVKCECVDVMVNRKKSSSLRPKVGEELDK
jgi:hypothetical protein